MTAPPEYDVRSASVTDLLRTYQAILGELRRRLVARTWNAPTGDVAELLIAIALDGERMPNSVKGYDVLTADGRRVQVKSRIVYEQSRARLQLGTFRSWEFTHLAVLLFGLDYSPLRASLIPVDVVRQAAREDAHVRGNRVIARPSLLDTPGVVDLTSGVLDAYNRLDVVYV